MRRELIGVLIGVLLASGAFLTRAFALEYHRLQQRVHFIEGYLGVLDKMLRSGR